MPDSAHAVSACLPLWEHNLAYEEGDQEVISQLQTAYPRFCLHPLVRRLCQQVFGSDQRGLIFPTLRAAERAVGYLRHSGVMDFRLVPLNNQPYVGVEVPSDAFFRLREYWQHAGEVISSRGAELILEGHHVSITDSDARRQVHQRLRDLHGNLSEQTWLYPCGMAAISSVWRAIRKSHPTDMTVQFGFPYVDTLKLQQKFSSDGCLFLPHGDERDMEQLRQYLRSEPVCAVFCESVANPLLAVSDLNELRRLADEYGFVLVIDDTLDAFVRDSVIPLADVVVTSLTKYFSGYGDVLAGAALLNPQSRHAHKLFSSLSNDFEEQLIDADIEVLERNSRDVRERVSVITRNAAVLAERLSQHPVVEKVFYPGLSADSHGVTSVGVRGGGLLSIVLRTPEVNTPLVYNQLEICKGPNLGTHFTLCCPYTLLAHYNELDFVESCGVSRWLLRISVGTEPIEELWDRFNRALSTVQCSGVFS